jgi:hypothetical protein
MRYVDVTIRSAKGKIAAKALNNPGSAKSSGCHSVGAVNREFTLFFCMNKNKPFVELKPYRSNYL